VACLGSTWGGLKHKRVYVFSSRAGGGILQIIYGRVAALLLSARGLVPWCRPCTRKIPERASQSIWHSHTPRGVQGRVFSIRVLIAWTILQIATRSEARSPHLDPV